MDLKIFQQLSIEEADSIFVCFSVQHKVTSAKQLEELTENSADFKMTKIILFIKHFTQFQTFGSVFGFWV